MQTYFLVNPNPILVYKYEINRAILFVLGDGRFAKVYSFIKWKSDPAYYLIHKYIMDIHKITSFSFIIRY